MQCRHCGSANLQTLGHLPPGLVFAGRKLDPPMPGGELWRCSDCDFVFRAPAPSQAELIAMYAGGNSEVWSVNAGREDFRLLKAAAIRARRVLDVGCYTGEFLASLDHDVRRFGVEPNELAAAVATKRGIDIIAPTVAEAARQNLQFDAVVACDVVEHIAEPGPFIETLWSLVQPGGQLLISTGAPDSWLWKLARSRFWYCYFPEHISFLSERWMRGLVGGRGLGTLATTRFNYVGFQAGAPRALLKLAAAGVYAIAPAAYQRWGGRGAAFSPPGCGATRDHALYAIHRC